MFLHATRGRSFCRKPVQLAVPLFLASSSTIGVESFANAQSLPDAGCSEAASCAPLDIRNVLSVASDPERPFNPLSQVKMVSSPEGVIYLAARARGRFEFNGDPKSGLEADSEGDLMVAKLDENGTVAFARLFSGDNAEESPEANGNTGGVQTPLSVQLARGEEAKRIRVFFATNQEMTLDKSQLEGSCRVTIAPDAPASSFRYVTLEADTDSGNYVGATVLPALGDAGKWTVTTISSKVPLDSVQYFAGHSNSNLSLSFEGTTVTSPGRADGDTDVLLLGYQTDPGSAETCPTFDYVPPEFQIQGTHPQLQFFARWTATTVGDLRIPATNSVDPMTSGAAQTKGGILVTVQHEQDFRVYAKSNEDSEPLPPEVPYVDFPVAPCTAEDTVHQSFVYLPFKNGTRLADLAKAKTKPSKGLQCAPIPTSSTASSLPPSLPLDTQPLLPNTPPTLPTSDTGSTSRAAVARPLSTDSLFPSNEDIPEWNPPELGDLAIGTPPFVHWDFGKTDHALTFGREDTGQVVLTPDSNEGPSAFAAAVNLATDKVEFARIFAGSGTEEVRVLQVDSLGSVVIAGHFDQDIDLGGDEPLLSQGGTDIFVARYSAQGEFLRQRRLGGEFDDTVEAITISPIDGRLTLFGQTGGNMQLANSTVPAGSFFVTLGGS